MRGGVTTTYSYDRADRITGTTSSLGGTSYTVDAAGNMTARGSDALAYDQANRLNQLVSNAVTTTYAYDGDGKWISKTVASTTTHSLYDVNRGLPVLLDDGARRYVWGLGLAYAVEGSSLLVYHSDGLGSVRAITDANKLVLQTYETDEFGAPVASSGGSAQPFGFTGEPRENAGLIHLRARDYDPSIGRFVSRDPLPGNIVESQSLNRFSYAQNNSCTYVDPSGLKAWAAQACGTAPAIPDHPEGFPAAEILARNMAISQTLGLPRIGVWTGLVMPYGAWDYKRRFDRSNTERYQDFGNFHYGATAAALGLDLYTATNGAGAVQMFQNGIRYATGDYLADSHGTLFLAPPYGDDTRDYLQVIQGYLYHAWYTCVNSLPSGTSAPPASMPSFTDLLVR